MALLLWGVVGALDLIDGRIAPRLFPAMIKAYWDALYFLPAFTWKGWLIVVVIILAAAAFEGAFRYSQGLAHQYNELAGIDVDEFVLADPNIREKWPEIVLANRDSEGFIVETDDERATDTVVVIPYKNERRADRAVGPAQGARIEIEYRNLATGNRVEVVDALWMSETAPSITLRPNAMHQVVVAVARINAPPVVHAPRRRQGRLLGKRIKDVAVPGDLILVTVSILNKAHKLLRRSQLILERTSDFQMEATLFAPWKNLQLLRLLVNGYQMMAAYREFRREGLDDLHFAWQKRGTAFLQAFYSDSVRKRFLLEAAPRPARESFTDRVDAQVKVLDELSERKRD